MTLEQTTDDDGNHSTTDPPILDSEFGSDYHTADSDHNFNTVNDDKYDNVTENDEYDEEGVYRHFKAAYNTDSSSSIDKNTNDRQVRSDDEHTSIEITDDIEQESLCSDIANDF